MDNFRTEDVDRKDECAGMGLSEILKQGFGDPRFYQRLEQMAMLHSRKNKDYAEGGLQGHLGNFARTSQIKRLYPGFDWSSPFGTAMDFMLKQLDAAFILYAQKKQSVTNENVPDRLQDVSIYSVIASLLWSDENDAIMKARVQNLIRDQEIVSPKVGQPVRTGYVPNPEDKLSQAKLTQSILDNVEKFSPDSSTKPERPDAVTPTQKHEGWQFRECNVPSCNLCRWHRELNPSPRDKF